jgi:hypothetical protein
MDALVKKSRTEERIKSRIIESYTVPAGKLSSETVLASEVEQWSNGGIHLLVNNKCGARSRQTFGDKDKHT